MFLPVSLFLFSLHAVSSEYYDPPTTTPKCTDGSDDGCISLTATFSEECKDECGCDGIFIYDTAKEECVLNMQHLKELMKTKDHITSDDRDIINDDGLAKQLQETNDKVFRGLVGSAIFVICCASACLISVCIYCCRMQYQDDKLKSEVDALRRKQENGDKKGLIKKAPKKRLHEKEESCNVMVGDDIICV